jgi:hypothetical protein
MTIFDKSAHSAKFCEIILKKLFLIMLIIDY